MKHLWPHPWPHQYHSHINYIDIIHE
jgi:hypothetical protein